MKKIFIIIITALISSLITIFGYWTLSNKNTPKEDISKEKYGLKDINKIEYDIPNFSIISTGLLISVINQDSLKDIQTYELTAIVSDSIYKHKYTYKGIRVKDVLTKLNFENYNKIIFKSNGGLQVEYTKDEINNLFLVFEKDGILYPEDEPVSLFNPTVYDRYNITNIEKMEFAK